jgi:hypothetical protein
VAVRRASLDGWNACNDRFERQPSVRIALPRSVIPAQAGTQIT